MMNWYHTAIFYELYPRAFADANGDGHGDFAGIRQRLDHLQWLGVDCIWLTPIYPSPLRDDGYDIAGFYGIAPQYGQLEDFKITLEEIHRRGMKLIMDLVVNHTSDEHPWFKESRSSKDSPYRDWYVWSEQPDKYLDARVIFIDTLTSNWTKDEVSGEYYWHRFYPSQPDLNYDNPKVRQAMLDIVKFWLDFGIDGFRVDAVPYLIEREGTICENLPETHEFVVEMRRFIDQHYPHAVILAEANQWAHEVVPYFGVPGKEEFHMCFNFPVMPRLYMALAKQDRTSVVEILNQTPPIPTDGQWATFLRNHDELTLEMVTKDERQFMWNFYSPDPNQRKNLGIRRRLAPLMDNDRRKIELLHSLLLTLPGTPMLYYGDEIGMGDNIYLGDRNGVRTPMQWTADRNAGFSSANPQRLFLPPVVDPEFHYQTVNVENQQKNPSSLLWWTKRLIALRRQYPTFGHGSFEPVRTGNRAVLAFVRGTEDQRLLVVANLSRFVQSAALDASSLSGMVPVEMFGGAAFPLVGNGRYRMSLGPHDFFWFHLQPGAFTEVSPMTSPAPTLTVARHWYELLDPARRTPELEARLGSWIYGRRWFRAKTSKSRVRIAGSIELDAAKDTRLVMLEVSERGGGADTYVVALRAAREEHEDALARVRRKGSARARALVDVSDDASLGGSLLALARDGRRTKTSLGTLVGTVPGELARLSALAAQPASTDQSNTCFVLGSEIVCKWLRKLEGGPSVEVEVLRELSARAPELLVPELLGTLDLHGNDGTTQTVASFTRFIESQGTAWQLTQDEVRRFFERALVHDGPEDVLGAFATIAERLAVRTAELHLALASSPHPDFVPKPLNPRAEYQARRALAARSIDTLERALPSLPPQTQQLARSVLAKRRALAARLRSWLDAKPRLVGMRIHGDYHLGQLLFTGRDFAVVDFEGEPARSLTDRRRRRSALTDVAGLLRSLDYAVHSVLHAEVPTAGPRSEDLALLVPWAERWLAEASAAFLSAYCAKMAGSGLLPDDERTFRAELDLCLLEKALYEVAYELENRPAWASIPLAGLAKLLGARVTLR